ncbi:MAG: ATP-binding cassette domain-containing protein, partial [Eggerthellaceae bacterium]|nr:ATP-binding cassette domain-containing protein [Eggerthellaceae bacterium]
MLEERESPRPGKGGEVGPSGGSSPAAKPSELRAVQSPEHGQDASPEHPAAPARSTAVRRPNPKSVPQVMQMEALECGAACLTMILAFFGRWVPLEQVRADCGVSRDGSKAANILKAARSYGLVAKGMTYSTKALMEKGDLPCIVFWNFNHFVVLTGFSHNGKHAYLNDPARGQVKVPIEQFDESFTGVALVFDRSDSFQEGGQEPSMLAFVRERLKGLGPSIAFAMATAAMAAIVGIVSTSLARVFLDRVLTGDDPGWLFPLTTLMLGLAIVSGAASILNAVHLARVRGKVAVVSSSRFMEHLLRLPVGFYAQRMVGDLQQRQQSTEQSAYMLVGQLAPVAVNIAMLVLYLAVMLRYSVPLALVGVLTVVLNAVVARMVSKMRVNVARSMTTDAGTLDAVTVGGVEMIETIKAAGAERGYFERWAGYQASVNEAEARLAYINERLGSVPLALTELANITVLMLGVWLIVEAGFTPGGLLAFQGFLLSFMTPVTQVIQLGQTMQEMRTQMERVDDVMRYPEDVPEDGETGTGDVTGDVALSHTPGDAETPLRDSATSPVTSPVASREKLTGRVDLEGVTFGYSPLEPPLIEGFDLHVAPGQWVALVGGSGCGKSTLAKLVSGLYDPWSGTVSFDGVPLREVPREVLRGSLAVVDQDIVTFDDTVAANIKLWDES